MEMCIFIYLLYKMISLDIYLEQSMTHTQTYTPNGAILHIYGN